MPKPSSPSLSDRLHEQARTLALSVSADIRNGNRSEARKALREAPQDVAFCAIGLLFFFIDGPSTLELGRFFDSFTTH